MYSTEVKVSTAEDFCFCSVVQNLELEAQNYQVRIQQILISLATEFQDSVSVKHSSQISFEKE